MTTETSSIFASKTSWTVAIGVAIAATIVGWIKTALPNTPIDPAVETAIAGVITGLVSAGLTRAVAWWRGKTETTTIDGPTYPKVRP